MVYKKGVVWPEGTLALAYALPEKKLQMGAGAVLISQPPPLATFPGLDKELAGTVGINCGLKHGTLTYFLMHIHSLVKGGKGRIFAYVQVLFAVSKCVKTIL